MVDIQCTGKMKNEERAHGSLFSSTYQESKLYCCIFLSWSADMLIGDDWFFWIDNHSYLFNNYYWITFNLLMLAYYIFLDWPIDLVTSQPTLPHFPQFAPFSLKYQNLPLFTLFQLLQLPQLPINPIYQILSKVANFYQCVHVWLVCVKLRLYHEFISLVKAKKFIAILSN